MVSQKPLRESHHSSRLRFAAPCDKLTHSGQGVIVGRRVVTDPAARDLDPAPPGRTVRIRQLILIVGLSLVVAYGLLGLATATTIDNDAGALQDSFRSILSGQYRPSRTSGFPVYEFLGAAAFAIGGVRAAMALSLVATVAALIILVKPAQARETNIGLIAWLGLALTPTILTNSSAVMETGTLLLLVCLFIRVIASATISQARRAFLMAVLSAALVLTRSDSVFFIAATTVAFGVWWWSTRTPGSRPWEALALVVGALAGVAILRLLTARNPFSPEFLPSESLVRRLLRGVIGTTTLFGPIGPFLLLALVGVLVLLVLRCRRSQQVSTGVRPFESRCFLAWWVLGTIGLYGLRFLGLPDELEYLLPVIVLLAGVSAALAAVSQLAGVLAAIIVWSATLTGLVTVSLLGRDSPWQQSPTIKPSVQPGAWIQDMQLRQAASVRSGDAYQAFLNRSLGELTEDIASGDGTLMPRDSWNYVVNAGYARYYDDFSRIIGCRELQSEVLIPGWRVSQPAASFGDIPVFNNGGTMSCEVVALLDGKQLTPVNSGLDAKSDVEYVRP